MKIEKDKFEPKTITLETQEELEIFYQIGNYAEPISRIISEKVVEKNAEKLLLRLYGELKSSQ